MGAKWYGYWRDIFKVFRRGGVGWVLCVFTMYALRAFWTSTVFLFLIGFYGMEAFSGVGYQIMFTLVRFCCNFDGLLIDLC